MTTLLQTFLVIACCIVPTIASAVPLETYEAAKDTEWATSYMAGVGNGFSWANAELKTRKSRPLYCVPPKLALNGNNYSQILMSYVDKMKAKGLSQPDDHIELLLIYALKEVFPCAAAR